MDMGQREHAGSVIEGKYRLEKELGVGGMGSVWLATQLMVERHVAVKLLNPAFVDSDDLQARFEVEAKAIGRLNHPNVITLYDFGYSDDLGAFYTVIEFIDGESLDKRLDRRLPLREIVAIIRQIALALDHAHHHGILHRDLKPENVMLAQMTDGSEMVKVLDFGIARIVKGSNEPESMESNRITKAGEVFGTPAYMSPEQARSIRRLEPSADLYSLGVMFYELVAGGLPFFAHSAFDLLMLHVTKPVPPIRRRNVPDELGAVIRKLLEKSPEDRYQSGKELVDALDALELPEEDDVDLSDLDSGPTLVQQTPQPTIATPPPMSLGDEGTNPDPPGFAAAGESADTHSRQTMVLDTDMSGNFDNPYGTDSFPDVDVGQRSNRVLALALAGVAIVAVCAAIVVSMLDERTSEAVAEEQGAEPEAAEMEIAAPEPDDESVEARDIAAAHPAAKDDTDAPLMFGDEVVEPEPEEPVEREAAAKPGKVEERPERKARPKPRPRRRKRAKPKPKPADDPLNIRLHATDDDDGDSETTISAPRFTTD